MLLLLGLLVAAETGEIPSLPPLKGDLEQHYDAYIAATDARIQREVQSAPYLWAEQSGERLQKVRRGEVVVQARNTRGSFEAGNGLLHDWMGAVFVPGAKLAQVVGVLQDCARHKEYYRPEVQGCRVIGHEGDHWKLRYRVVKRYFITVVANTDQDVDYTSLGSTRTISRSVASRIAEVKDAGKPTEREIDPRKESTIVWRLNTYWRLEEKDGGTYIECETVSLTRAAPVGLGWLVNPIIRSLPGGSVAHLLEGTRGGVERQIGLNSPKELPSCPSPASCLDARNRIESRILAIFSRSLDAPTINSACGSSD